MLGERLGFEQGLPFSYGDDRNGGTLKALIVCSALGLATDGYSFPYVATWAGGDRRMVTDATDETLNCAEEILAAVHRRSGVRDPRSSLRLSKSRIAVISGTKK
jgi:hypothetical protein